jgi:hypothetical protein
MEKQAGKGFERLMGIWTTAFKFYQLKIKLDLTQCNEANK